MEQWIIAIRNGDNDVLVEKYEQYKPIVLSIRNNITLRFYDLDDWLQEGMIVFYKSVLNYSDDRGVTFGLYFKGNMKRHVVSLLRKEQAMKRRGDIEATYIEDNAMLANNNFRMDNDTNISDYADYVSVAEKAGRFVGELSAFERHVCTLYFGNAEPAMIASMIGCGEKKIKSTIDRITRKLKKQLSEDD